jgi:hypothetical protein
MLLIFKHNDRKFLTDENIWLASAYNCDNVRPEYKIAIPLVSLKY